MEVEDHSPRQTHNTLFDTVGGCFLLFTKNKMSNRRMFSKDITSSDAFLDMPSSTQCLYFQLWMHADDDWFLWSAKRISRMLWCNDDDFKILVAKRFVLVFDNWICVIKHWRMNNQIRKDRYKMTTYRDELKKLRVKENGSYTEKKRIGNQLATKWQPIGNQLATQYSIVEDSIVENSVENVSFDDEKDEELKVPKDLQTFVDKWNSKKRHKWRPWLKSCRKITWDIVDLWRKWKKQYWINGINDAVRSYINEFENRPDTMSDHRFSLYEFFTQKNWLKKFYNI